MSVVNIPARLGVRIKGNSTKPEQTLTAAVPVRFWGCATGSEAVPSEVLDRINFQWLLDECKRKRGSHGGIVDINGNRVEVFLGGSKGAKLMRYLGTRHNPSDNNARWSDSIDALKISAIEKAKTFLRDRVGLTELQVNSMLWENFALVTNHQSSHTAQQAPHVDMVDGAQFVMACTDGCAPTMVYDSDVYPSSRSVLQRWPPTPQEAAVSQGRSIRAHHQNVTNYNIVHTQQILDAIAVTLEPRDYIQMSMTSAQQQPLRRGEFTALWGPVMHAGPEVPRGTLRVVLFFTGRMPRAAPYDNASQFTPWASALEYNIASLIVHASREYRDHRPWESALEDEELSDLIEESCDSEDVEGMEGRIRNAYTENPQVVREVLAYYSGAE